MHHLLNLLIWLPIIGGVFVFFTGDDKNPNVSKYLSLFTVILTLFMCIPLVTGFDINTYTDEIVMSAAIHAKSKKILEKSQLDTMGFGHPKCI